VTCAAAAASAWLSTWKESRLNWKLKIRKTANDAGINQSQARDIRQGFIWDDLRKIFRGCQWMAEIANGEEKLPKISTG